MNNCKQEFITGDFTINIDFSNWATPRLTSMTKSPIPTRGKITCQQHASDDYKLVQVINQLGIR